MTLHIEKIIVYIKNISKINGFLKTWDLMWPLMTLNTLKYIVLERLKLKSRNYVITKRHKDGFLWDVEELNKINKYKLID